MKKCKPCKITHKMISNAIKYFLLAGGKIKHLPPEPDPPVENAIFFRTAVTAAHQ